MLSGEEVAGPHVRAACKRRLSDLVEGRSRSRTATLKTMQPICNRPGVQSSQARRWAASRGSPPKGLRTLCRGKKAVRETETGKPNCAACEVRVASGIPVQHFVADPKPVRKALVSASDGCDIIRLSGSKQGTPNAYDTQVRERLFCWQKRGVLSYFALPRLRWLVGTTRTDFDPSSFAHTAW